LANQTVIRTLEKQVSQQVDIVAEKARLEWGVTLTNLSTVFSGRGKKRIANVRQAPSSNTVLINRKWVTEENRDEILHSIVPWTVANLTAMERYGKGVGKDAIQKVALALGCRDPREPASCLTRPASCNRKPKTKPYGYVDTAGKTRWVSTRLHNRMQREGVVYTYRDNGAKIGKTDFKFKKV
jgi:hypothetical protein